MYCPNRECPDFQEDGVPGEYLDTVSICPKCGAALVAEWPPAEAPREPLIPSAPEEEGATCAVEQLPRGPLVALAAFDYPDETEPFVAALEKAGIAVFQFIDDGRDFEDRGGIQTCTRLLVPESQAARATVVLKQVEARA
ncbi:MAG: hypothetical protein LAO05_03815 [Acidobacteriia bacterium]|nr:hypothetical protein [Terriglobia bacterium]